MLTNSMSGVATVYQWDARNQLVGIETNGVTMTKFDYDGAGRRSRIIEYDSSGMSASTNQYIWCGLSICEQRSGDNGGTVEKRYFSGGMEKVQSPNAGNYYYTRDHLGSIRELVQSDGTTVAARYDYDPYGRRTLVSGTGLADFGYTGHYYHAASGLHLAPFRAYDANLGRWLSRDPIAESGGLNLYGYVYNDPINNIDPFGLKWIVDDAPVDPKIITQMTDGKGGIVPSYFGQTDPSRFKHLADCIRIHEESHIEDILKQNPDISKDINSGKDKNPGLRIINDDPVELAESEVKAYNREIDCLNEKEKNAVTDEEKSKFRFALNNAIRQRNINQAIIDMAKKANQAK